MESMAYAPFAGLFGFLVLFRIVTTLGVGYDAHKHGGNAAKWFLLTLVLGVFGLIWYSSATSEGRVININTYRVYGQVRDANKQAEKRVEISVTTDAASSAVTRFKAECSDSGYLPLEEPTVGVEPDGNP